MPRPFACAVSVSVPVWYPNTRKHEEALVGASKGLYRWLAALGDQGHRAGRELRMAGLAPKREPSRDQGGGGGVAEKGPVLPRTGEEYCPTSPVAISHL